MKKAITHTQFRHMEAAVANKVRHYERCRKQLRRIDQEVLQAGISCFGSASTLALWLCAPAVGLGGKVPLQIMRTAKGRKDVVNLLGRIDYGVY
jgi:uncharacterized protein (DUF2384 family)